MAAFGTRLGRLEQAVAKFARNVRPRDNHLLRLRHSGLRTAGTIFQPTHPKYPHASPTLFKELPIATTM